MASIRRTISVNRIAQDWKSWVTCEEYRQNWIKRFTDEIKGIRANMERYRADANEEKDERRRAWMVGHVDYLRKEIEKREKYIRQLKELEI